MYATTRELMKNFDRLIAVLDEKYVQAKEVMMEMKIFKQDTNETIIEFQKRLVKVERGLKGKKDNISYDQAIPHPHKSLAYDIARLETRLKYAEDMKADVDSLLKWRRSEMLEEPENSFALEKPGCGSAWILERKNQNIFGVIKSERICGTSNWLCPNCAPE